MSRITDRTPENLAASSYLAANAALLILTGFVCGLLVPAAPYPRLMLTAHIQFVVNGIISLLAGLMLRTSLSIAGKRAAEVIVVAHTSAWFLCSSEVGAAIWGARKTLPIAAAEAGASGAAPWQESLVLVCHMIPALLFIAAWTLLVLGVYKSKISTRPA
jgi:hydroxylaminobenzene mutase